MNGHHIEYAVPVTPKRVTPLALWLSIAWFVTSVGAFFVCASMSFDAFYFNHKQFWFWKLATPTLPLVCLLVSMFCAVIAVRRRRSIAAGFVLTLSAACTVVMALALVKTL